MKNEIVKYYDIVSLLNLNNFVALLFASLASKSENTSKRTAKISFEYLRIIEMIMQNESWGIRFSTLIDIQKYYMEQSAWEFDLGEEIDHFLSGRNVNYDFSANYFFVELTEEEIQSTFSKYDNDILESMDHFTNLLSDYSTRRGILQQREISSEIDKRIRESTNYIEELIRRTLKR